MAYTEVQWERAKAYYEAGLSLSQIKDKTSIARNTVSQRAKREQWEQGKNTEYIEAKVNLAEKKGTILEQSGTVALNIADNIAEEKIIAKGKVFGYVHTALKKMNEIVEHGRVEEKINIGDGMQRFEERKLNTSDIKNALDGYDRAAITLELAPRHSSQSINIQNTNATQNISELTIEEAKREAELLGVPLSALTH